MGMVPRWVAAVVAAVTWACGEAPRLETRTFELRYLDGESAEGIIAPYVYADRPEAPGQVSLVDNVITVRETSDNLERIGRVLAQFDRSQPTVRLTFRVIEADGATVRDTAIADVEAMLRRMFRFTGYRLMTDAVVTGIAGTNASQTLSGPGAQYLLETRVHRLFGSGDSTMVALRVRFVGSRTGSPGHAQFETEVQLPVGKTAVLGSVRADARQPTLILAVQPQLLEN